MKIDSAHKRPDGIVNSQSHPLGINVYPEAIIHDKDSLLPRVVFRGEVLVEVPKDYLILGPIGSRADYLTVTFRPVVRITTGCFSGTLEEFQSELEDKPADKVKQEYTAAVDLIRMLSVIKETKEEVLIAYGC